MSPPEEPLPPSKTKIEFRNDGKTPLEAIVEPYPDRYVLQPGDTLVLSAELDHESGTRGSFAMNADEGGLQIDAGWDFEPPACINGVLVQPDWTTPTGI